MKLIKYTDDTMIDAEYYYKIVLEDHTSLVLNDTEYKILKKLIDRFE